MTNRPRIVFMGTPEFAVGVLKRLVEDGQQIVGVITAADKPAGRGRKLRSSAVKQFAQEQGFPILQPTNLKDEVFLEELDSWKADLQVVVAFRMLPEVVWKSPKLGTFNLHASLLPQYRGAAPINWAIIDGQEVSGVTTFFIDEQIDTGAIIDSAQIAIATDETAGSLHDKLMDIGADLVVKTVRDIASGQALAKPQPLLKDIRKAPKLNPENTRIDWHDDPIRTHALIRGLCPYPLAWTELIQGDDRIKVKVYQGHFEAQEHSLKTGSIRLEKKALGVAVKDGFYWLEDLKLAGKRRMVIQELLNGFRPETEAYFE